jgi:GxxExxY protein
MLLLEDETYKIIGTCMKVHKALGNGFLESVYQEALGKAFLANEIPFEQKKMLKIKMGEINLDKYFVADFVCYDNIILEIKASKFIHKDNESQTINYLKASGLSIGLLINFGQTSLQWKRFINTPNPRNRPKGAQRS